MADVDIAPPPMDFWRSDAAAALSPRKGPDSRRDRCCSRSGSESSVADRERSARAQAVLLRALADTLGVPLSDLLAAEPPNRRAALEISLERAQQGALYQSSVCRTSTPVGGFRSKRSSHLWGYMRSWFGEQ
jgi:hypothetical protein